MRSLSGSSVTTFLMFLPLAAVPLLAIFGIPEFTAVNASPSGVERGSLTVTDRNMIPEKTERRSADALFAPVVERFDGSAVVQSGSFNRREDPFNATENSTGIVRSNPDESVDGRRMRGWAVDINRPKYTDYESQTRDTSSRRRAGSVSDRRQANVVRSQPSVMKSQRTTGIGQRTNWVTGDRRPSEIRRSLSFADYVEERRFPNRSEKATRRRAEGGGPRASRVGYANLDLAEKHRMVGTAPPTTAKPGPLPLALDTRPSALSKLTWRSAVRRLNELGIRDFRLQPGSSTGEFHFSCTFKPDGNGRIAHRFEAEDTEPLKAVDNVLRQIESWLRRR